MGLLDFTPEQADSLLNFGTGLLAAGGPSRTPVSFGQAFAGGIGNMQQQEQVNLRQQALRQQMEQEQYQTQMMREKFEQERQDREAAVRRQEAVSRALSTMPPEVQNAVQAGVPYSEIWKNQNTAFNLGTGEKRFVGNRVVAEGGPKVPEGMEVGPDGNLRFIPAYLSGKQQIAQAGRSQLNTNVFNNTKDDFKNERDLRNDFSGLATTKAFNEVQSAHDQIKTAIKTPSPAGDLAAATKIMKILDPGSVVRESELAMAMSATGALDRVQNYAQMVVSGQKLTPAQRKDFGELSDKLYEAAAERYNASADEYQSVAKDYNLNPGRVAKKAVSSTKPAQSTISSGGWSATVVK